MRKGQAALEFLMTYGWAILVVLAAIAALAYFGVLSPDRFLPNKCTIQGGFSCTEYKVSGATDTVQVNVQNNLGTGADMVNVSITSTDCPAIAPATAADRFGGQLDNGKRTGLLNWSCGAELGSKFSGDIVVVYTRAGETVSHTASGSITGAVE